MHQVLAVAGPTGLRIVWCEPVAGGLLVRQSDVDLTMLSSGEELSVFAWTPSGALLLGTTASRLLLVPSAAPPAVPAAGWGSAPGGGHAAEWLYGSAQPASPAGPVEAQRQLGGAAAPGVLVGSAPPLEPRPGASTAFVHQQPKRCAMCRPHPSTHAPRSPCRRGGGGPHGQPRHPHPLG
jgi:hypothetical protein